MRNYSPLKIREKHSWKMPNIASNICICIFSYYKLKLNFQSKCTESEKNESSHFISVFFLHFWCIIKKGIHMYRYTYIERNWLLAMKYLKEIWKKITLYFFYFLYLFFILCLLLLRTLKILDVLTCLCLPSMSCCHCICAVP